MRYVSVLFIVLCFAATSLACGPRGFSSMSYGGGCGGYTSYTSYTSYGGCGGGYASYGGCGGYTSYDSCGGSYMTYTTPSCNCQPTQTRSATPTATPEAIPQKAPAPTATPPVSIRASMNGSEECIITVQVPADARVYINGKPTQSTGTNRTYISKGLRADYTYHYAVAVETSEGNYQRKFRTVAFAD